ncbi:hypothetical protein [Paenibacillus durus]|uniref:Lipoprotein n=1 Tax=Paenibacillus durus TaxID=44251 RepID=A0A089HU78_PAEDU|nr:hypothetical protein [Paenibacillus durus]AIQ14305.1 hypothetical protein PDUR_22165 [Paenibacillus durus]
MRQIVLILSIFLINFLTGCTQTNRYQFNDNDIKISLINQQNANDYRAYSIEVENTGKLEIKYINLYLYFPVILPTGSKGNPFKMEGKTEISKPINLKSGEEIIFNFFAPTKEVFGDSKLLDFDDPQIELNGIVKQGKSEIPFIMSGGYLNNK